MDDGRRKRPSDAVLQLPRSKNVVRLVTGTWASRGWGAQGAGLSPELAAGPVRWLWGYGSRIYSG